MRGTRAKKIRRSVYGDKSRRGTKYRRMPNGMIITEGMRAIYRSMKILYKKRIRGYGI